VTSVNLCEFCNKPFEVLRTRKRFCSASCSASWKWEHNPPRRLSFPRLGVMLTQQKTKIFDKIAAAGDEGISSRELLGVSSGSLGILSKRLKTHIHAINELLEETDYVIKSDGIGQPYKLQLRDPKPEPSGRRAKLIQMSRQWIATHQA